ncbi:DegT/DnrJ/EryC1/StrS family aminotransferase [Acidobacteriota bacterium]
MKIPLSSPDISDLEKSKVLEVLDTPNLSFGPKLEEFEKKFADYIGCKHAVAVNSGTSGLHLCVRALGINEEELAITTPFSFISSANCMLFERAKPVFVDIDEKTLNIDENLMADTVRGLKKKGSELKAILPVHVFGLPNEMDSMMGLAQRYDLFVIEDACEAVGAEYLTKNSQLLPGSTERDLKTQTRGSKKGDERNKKKEDEEIWRKVGTFGECGIFAFYPNKQITTGEGGMIVTDDENIYRLCRSMRNQGRSEDGVWLQHERVGFNYRISDINCALGIAQLERIDEILGKRAKVARLYNERLKNVEELILPHSEENKKISWFVYVIRLQDKYSREDRDRVLEKLKEKGIGCSNYFSPIHLQPFYRRLFGYKEGDFPVTEKVSERTMALPFFNNLKEEEIDYVCENLINIVRNIK